MLESHHKHGKAAIPEDVALECRIGRWTVARERNRVYSSNSSKSVEPKVMDVLAVLMRKQGQVVSRADIEDAVWPNAVIGEKVLTRAISELRKVFEDDADKPGIIETVPRRGYRLSVPIRPVPAARTRYLTLAALAFGVTAVLMGLYWLQLSDTEVGPADPWRQITSLPGHELNPAISPRGDLVAYARTPPGAQSTSIFLMQIHGDDDMQITDSPANDTSPRWAPDGSQIAFLRFAENECRIMTVATLGGVATPLTYCGLSPARANFAPTLDWSPDGAEIVFTDAGPDSHCRRITRLDIKTGERQLLLGESESACQFDVDPVYAPDGGSLAFTRMVQPGIGDLFVFDLTEQSLQRLTKDYASQIGAAWMGPEKIVVSSNRSGTYRLWQIELDSQQMTWFPTSGSNVKRPSTNIAGMLSFENWQYDMNIWSGTPNARDAQPLIASTVWDFHPGLSPDGNAIAFVSNRGGNFELWLSTGTNSFRQLTRTSNRVIGFPAWSPDGESIAYVIQDKNRQKIRIISRSGGAIGEIENKGNTYAPTWSADGTSIIYGSDVDGASELWKFMTDTQTTIQLTTTGGVRGMEDHSGNLYLTQKGKDGIWLVDKERNAPRLIADLPMTSWADWTILEGRLVYPDGRPGLFKIANLATGQPEPGFTIPGRSSRNAQGVQFSADLSRILWTQLDATEADIVVGTELESQ